jgi:hypothetical protein
VVAPLHIEMISPFQQLAIEILLVMIAKTTFNQAGSPSSADPKVTP